MFETPGTPTATTRPGPPRSLRATAAAPTSRQIHRQTLGLAAVIAVLLLVPVPARRGALSTLGDWDFDKLIHAALTGTLAWCSARSLRRLGHPHATSTALLAALLATAWVAGLEPIQAWLGRDGSWFDAAADGIGAGLAAWWWRRQPR